MYGSIITDILNNSLYRTYLINAHTYFLSYRLIPSESLYSRLIHYNRLFSVFLIQHTAFNKSDLEKVYKFLIDCFTFYIYALFFICLTFPFIYFMCRKYHFRDRSIKAIQTFCDIRHLIQYFLKRNILKSISRTNYSYIMPFQSELIRIQQIV